ncbi:MAG: extracellular solute-binding protein [Ignavibacteria bacterium]|nr:extracellular solute-binding protein [Ignavibacteria bacterium]
MNKILIVLIVASSFLVSCGEKNKSDSKKITFWHFWSEPYQRTVVDSLVKEFEKQEKVEVEITELSWGDGKVKLLAAFNSNTAPDVLELGSDWVSQFSSAGVLSDISHHVEMSKYLDFAQEPCRWENGIYALPWIVDTRVLFINMDLLKANGFENPPTTYAEMLEMSKVINKGDIYGFGINGSDKHRLYKKVLSFIWSEGGNIYDGKNFQFDSPQVIAGVQKYKDLAQYGIVDTQKELDNYFAKGRLAFWISGSWLLKKVDEFAKVKDMQLVRIPDFSNNGVSFAGGEYLSISKKSENQELALKLVKFLTDGKNSVEFCRNIPEAGFPADKEYYSSDFYDNEYKAVFAQQLESSKMTPMHPKWLEVEELFEGAVEQILYDRMTTEQAMKDLQSKIKGL